MDKQIIIDRHNYFKDRVTKKCVFEMGEDKEGGGRIKQVLNRFEKISKFVFVNSDVWVLIIFWNPRDAEHPQFKDYGFNICNSTCSIKGDKFDGMIDLEKYPVESLEEAQIYYMYYQRFDYDKIFPLVYCKAAFELGCPDSVGITVHYYSFSEDLFFLNLYDDRGMEFITTSENGFEKVVNHFQDFVKQ